MWCSILHGNRYEESEVDGEERMKMKKRWLVRLEGHHFDLEMLNAKVQAEDLRIEKRGDRYYLESEAFRNLKKSADVRSAAAEVLELLNGAARVFRGRYEPVRLSGEILEITDGQERTNIVIEPESLVSRMRIGGTAVVAEGKASSSAGTPSTEVTDLVKTALNDRTVADVLHFMSLEQTWINLSKVWELVKEDMGYRNAVKRFGDPQIKRFTGTAQSRKIVGDAARHAGLKKYPGPGKRTPMTLREARRFITDVVQQWLATR